MTPDELEQLLMRTRGPALPSRLQERVFEEATRTRRLLGRAPWFLTGVAASFFALLILGIVLSGIRRSTKAEGVAALPPLGRAPEEPIGPKTPDQEGDAFLSLPGELKANREVAIYARVQAYVERLEVDRGSHVRRGQALAHLTAPELQAQCEAARVQFGLDDAEFRRLKAVESFAAVAPHDVAISQAKREISQARLKACEANLAYLEITAPFDGVITKRDISVGSLVGPLAGSDSQPLVTLQEVARLRLEVLIPEGNLAAALKSQGQRVMFLVDGFPGERFDGVVARLAGAVDPKTHTMAAELDVDNAAGRLLSGMSARVQWPIKR